MDGASHCQTVKKGSLDLPVVKGLLCFREPGSRVKLRVPQFSNFFSRNLYFVGRRNLYEELEDLQDLFSFNQTTFHQVFKRIPKSEQIGLRNNFDVSRIIRRQSEFSFLHS